MNEMLRTTTSAVVGAVVAIGVVAGQPALAHQAERGGAKKVTSVQIKDGTIKPQDLSAAVAGPLAKADSALQGIPDGSVSTAKLPDNAVTGTKLAAGSVTGPKLANGSVTAQKLAFGSVSDYAVDDESLTGADLMNGSLTMRDLAYLWSVHSIDFGNMLAGQCGASTPIYVGFDPTSDFIFLSQPPFAGAVVFSARPSATQNSIDIIWCNNGSGAYDPPPYAYRWAVIRSS